MTVILGAGVSGLAAGLTSGLPVFEAAESPGGICSSYYLEPGCARRLHQPPRDGEAYRFELGGGHWIFGGDAATLEFIDRTSPTRRYARRSSVLLDHGALSVPYPLQNHLDSLGAEVAACARAEMASAGPDPITMQDWLSAAFGPTLCRIFFDPFHDRYTAGLYRDIVPQDAYKTPVVDGTGPRPPAETVGYNPTFAYPERGLDHLVSRMAAGCQVQYAKRCCRIDVADRVVHFDDGTAVGYDTLISTLPLNTTVALAQLHVDGQASPYTSVLVLNVGGERGDATPDDHWVYIPDSSSGYYRVGFYSNVDPSFLPASARHRNDRVGLYAERAYVGGVPPDAESRDRYLAAAVAELQATGVIGTAEVVDPTWIEVAYTWAYPGGRWAERAIGVLAGHGIHQVGRYGRWTFQGIADSIRDGFAAGASALSG